MQVPSVKDTGSFSKDLLILIFVIDALRETPQ
jgi:hypothetical protein